MVMSATVKEIECKSAIGKCGFPGGGWAINPYIGCEHNCVYCYARFMKRFTGHAEKWGSFVDVKTNIAEVLEKQMSAPRFSKGQIYIGTVTDPYQQAEKKYKVTRGVLQVLSEYDCSVSIMTKSDLVLRDVDLLKKFKNIDVNFTVNTLDEDWKKLVEPSSSTIRERLDTMERLTKEGIRVFAMVGPYWPIFTDLDGLFKEFSRVGVSRVFSESFNTIGGNWTGVEGATKERYPQELEELKQILFNKNRFYDFYTEASEILEKCSDKYGISVTSYFKPGHAGKFADV